MRPHNSLRISQKQDEKTETGAPKEEKKEKSPQKIKENLISFFVFVIILFVVSRFLGGDGWDAPVDVISHPQIGEWGVYLLLTIGILVVINYQRGELGWEAVTGWLKVFSFLVLVVILILSIWPDFSLQKVSKTVDSQKKERKVEIKETKGFNVTPEGNLVASIDLGEETSRSFVLKPGEKTPWIVIPENYYQFRFTNLQTVIVHEKGERTVVHPEEYYDMGTTHGKKRMRFEAPAETTAKVILHIEKEKRG